MNANQMPPELLEEYVDEFAQDLANGITTVIEEGLFAHDDRELTDIFRRLDFALAHGTGTLDHVTFYGKDGKKVTVRIQLVSDRTE